MGQKDKEVLVEQLVQKLRVWFAQAAPRVRDEIEMASLTITLHSPAYSEDDKRTLSADLEEKFTADGVHGRVPELD